MGEIEHFVDPGNKTHERFFEVLGTSMPLLDRQAQLAGSTNPKIIKIEEAVEAHIIDNETLGYFLARIYGFLLKIGVDESKIRFRQHMANEMAHYACDCWGAELLTSFDWIECVGCADRSAYDLTVHSNFTGADLKVKEALPNGPVRKQVWKATLNKKLAGPKFKEGVDIIQKSIDAIGQPILEDLAVKLDELGVVDVETVTPLLDGRQSVELSSEILIIQKETRLGTIREYTPSVIEPSFGIGRVLYSLLEHVYWYRQQVTARVVGQLHQQFSDAELTGLSQVLSLPTAIAPTKVLIVPISSAPQFKSITRKLSSRFRVLGLSNNVDSSSASLGKRYARNDELGTPLAITIDHTTLLDDSITLRERDSTDQVRGSENEVLEAVKSMVTGVEMWKDIAERLASFTVRDLDE